LPLVQNIRQATPKHAFTSLRPAATTKDERIVSERQSGRRRNRRFWGPDSRFSAFGGNRRMLRE
jgi:hypothetical protein